MADQLSIPVIASGGAGLKEHFRDAFLVGKADAALAASVFHFGEIKIPELKSACFLGRSTLYSRDRFGRGRAERTLP